MHSTTKYQQHSDGNTDSGTAAQFGSADKSTAKDAVLEGVREVQHQEGGEDLLQKE